MHTQNTPDSLSSFNNLVQAHQEQAFNLACFLLGDEKAAERATQAGVLSAYRAWKQGQAGSFERRLLASVARACRTHKPNQKGAVHPALDRLPFELRLAVSLVDALGVGNEEAARIAGWPKQRLNQALAEGRKRMIQAN